MQLSIRVSFLVLILMTLTVCVAVAESKYVSDNFEVPLRTGPGSDRKIIALIPTGLSVEIISSGEEWSEVLYKEKQGWTLSRYLTDKVPAALALERLQQKHNDMLTKYKEMELKLTQLTSENKSMSGELSQTQNNFKELTSAHESLKNESSEFLKLKAKFDKAVKEMNAARDRADKIESDFNKLSSSEINKGMIYGGGLVFIGLIIGFILKRPKRRVPLM